MRRHRHQRLELEREPRGDAPATPIRAAPPHPDHGPTNPCAGNNPEPLLHLQGCPAPATGMTKMQHQPWPVNHELTPELTNPLIYPKRRITIATTSKSKCIGSGSSQPGGPRMHFPKIQLHLHTASSLRSSFHHIHKLLWFQWRSSTY